VTNLDISHIVLEKMREHYVKNTEKYQQCQNFSYLAMDATRMDFRDDCFDVVIDKGTYDALACDETDKTMIRNLTKEMLRVTAKNGAVVIITNGVPQKRMDDLRAFTSDYKVLIEHSKIELSKLS